MPVYNRGVTTNLPTTAHITFPDGYEVTETLPALALYEQYIFEIEWQIDENSSIDNITIEWEADIIQTNSNDAEFDNNRGVLPIFVGRLLLQKISLHGPMKKSQLMLPPHLMKTAEMFGVNSISSTMTAPEILQYKK